MNFYFLAEFGNSSATALMKLLDSQLLFQVTGGHAHRLHCSSTLHAQRDIQHINEIICVFVAVVFRNSCTIQHVGSCHRCPAASWPPPAAQRCSYACRGRK